ncbi:MAG: hypothetical protein HKN75_07405 [Bacteroidia bacterium]|nr:hypothetical protein [Bacteroidia bacterium]
MAHANYSANKEKLVNRLTKTHQDSQEWLSAIEFWKFELVFFQKLIDKNFLRVTLVDKMRALEEYEKQINHLMTHDLAQVEAEVKKHEHYLNKIESGDSDVDDVTYRAEHQNEAMKMNKITLKIRDFKKSLFNNIEHLSDHSLT